MAILDSTTSVRGWRKTLVSVWTCFECMFFAGLFFGWSSLVFVFKEEGIYRDLCDEDDKNSSISSEMNKTSHSIGPEQNLDCRLQDGRFALCFTVSTFVCGGISSSLGYINYKTGTRVTRLISYAICTAGILCLAFVSRDVPWLVYPGLSLISVGGLSFHVSNAQVAYIFTKYSSTYMGLLCGAMDTSSVVFLLVKIAHQHGFSRQNMLFLITALFGGTLVSTFLFLPKWFVHVHVAQKTISKVGTGSNVTEDKDAVYSKDERASVLNILKQPLFITFCMWLALLQLRFFCFVGTLNVFLNNFLENDHNQVSYYTDVFYYTSMFGLVMAIVVGIIYDRLKRIFRRGQSQQYQNLVPAIIPMSCASLLSVLISVTILIRYEPLLYVLFITIIVKRSFLYSMVAAYITAVFPSQFFGILFGVAFGISAVIACFQYALFYWAESYDDGRFHADICLLFISLVTLCHPVYMWISAVRAENREDSSSQLMENKWIGSTRKQLTLQQMSIM